MTLTELNELPASGARWTLMRCCGSSRWADAMVAARPFADVNALYLRAEREWQGLSEADWLEAFTHHPRIGDRDALRAKFATTSQWATQEQAGVAGASDEVLDALAQANADYEKRFGYIFLICATGKSASQMLDLLKSRLPNRPEAEIIVAAAEQAKITRIRLEKLLQ